MANSHKPTGAPTIRSSLLTIRPLFKRAARGGGNVPPPARDARIIELKFAAELVGHLARLGEVADDVRRDDHEQLGLAQLVVLAAEQVADGRKVAHDRNLRARDGVAFLNHAEI